MRQEKLIGIISAYNYNIYIYICITVSVQLSTSQPRKRKRARSKRRKFATVSDFTLHKIAFHPNFHVF